MEYDMFKAALEDFGLYFVGSIQLRAIRDRVLKLTALPCA